MKRTTGAAAIALIPLTCAFAMSHAFRTMVTLISAQLDSQLALSAQAIGVVAGAFHLAFGISQLPMGVLLDVSGPRRVVAFVFPITILGAAISAFASGATVLVAGQILVGIGCAPVFLAAAVLISKSYPVERFSRLSGLVLGGGGLGMLVTGSPLAWVVETYSWRVAYGVLMAISVAIWIWLLCVMPKDSESDARPPRIEDAIKQVRFILSMRHTVGILALGSVTYASFIALRGLWIVPLLTHRHQYSLVQSGNVALVMSAITIVGPILFGRIDPGGRSRRSMIIGFTIVYSVLFGVLAFGLAEAADLAIILLSGLLAGYFVLQYSDVRSSYDVTMAGRALAMFNSAMFVGVAVVQWLSSYFSEVAIAHGHNPLTAAFACIGICLIGGVLTFVLAPWPAGMRRPRENEHGGLSPTVSSGVGRDE